MILLLLSWFTSELFFFHDSSIDRLFILQIVCLPNFTAFNLSADYCRLPSLISIVHCRFRLNLFLFRFSKYSRKGLKVGKICQVSEICHLWSLGSHGLRGKLRSVKFYLFQIFFTKAKPQRCDVVEMVRIFLRCQTYPAC